MKSVKPLGVPNLGKYPDDEHRFDGEFIAVFDDRIVAHSPDGAELVTWIRKEFPEWFDTIGVTRVMPEGVYVI